MVKRDDVIFERLDDAGWTANEIGKYMGVTARTVCRWRRDTGRSKGEKHVLNLEALAQAEVLIADGCSLKEVARSVDVGYQTLLHRYPEARMTREQISELASIAATYRELRRAA